MKVVVAVAFCASFAWAKGEGGGGSDVPCEAPDAPRAYTVRFPPDDTTPIVVGTNFGLLLSYDTGKTFDFVCQQTLGVGTLPNGLVTSFVTSTVALLPGVVLASRSFGLYRSEDGCAWLMTEDDYVATHGISSLAVSPPGTLFASIFLGAAPREVLRSEDALTFEDTGLPTDNVGWTGVVAAADGQTLYAVAIISYPGPEQGIYRSDDAGETWTLVSTLNTGNVSLGVVDPNDPNRLFMRQRGSGFCLFSDTLLLSEDGGATQPALFVAEEDAVTGAVFRPDGAVWVATLESGVQVSADQGQSWRSLGGPAQARCLVGSADQVLVCLRSPDAELGLIASTSDEGQTFTPWLTFDRIGGPADCLADTCEYQWSLIVDNWISPVPPADGGDGGSPADGGSSDATQFSDADMRESTPAGCSCSLGTGSPPARF